MTLLVGAVTERPGAALLFETSPSGSYQSRYIRFEMFPFLHVVLTRWDARRCAPGTAGEQAVPKPVPLQVAPGLATDSEVHPISGSKLVAKLSRANGAGINVGGIKAEQAYQSRRLVVLPGALGHCPSKGETDQASDGPAFLRPPHWGRPHEGMSNTLTELSENHATVMASPPKKPWSPRLQTWSSSLPAPLR